MPGKKKGAPPKQGPDSEGVSFTDYGRSGVIYKDDKGNTISKEEWLDKADQQDMEKRSMGGEMMCPHRPDGVRGQGKAIRGSKFSGLK